MIGGASSRSIAGTIQRRGNDISLAARDQLRSAGASKNVLQEIVSGRHATNVTCPTPLIRASELTRHKQYADASELIAAALETDPHNGALHFALGFTRQQQGDWDSAFDEYSASKEAEPDFGPVHDRLALVFYNGDDGDNAIAEARTGLSIDFEDAEEIGR